MKKGFLTLHRFQRPNSKVLVPFVMLAVVLAASSVYAIATFRSSANVTVHEPITWGPASIAVDAWAGESKSYSVKICNAAGFPITVKFTAEVSTAPTGGALTDITLNATVNGVTSPVVPAITIPLAVGSGSYDQSTNTGVCTNVQVNFDVSPAAQAGTYMITDTVTKA